ncbi:UNVERIFIED_CONTAM: Uricase [Sesamum radiatum]|uniref:factor independent urate hydroxylase n=1 Tax=Sesamum radiatum TaxID=300843 RepID=A0AAW2JXI4_SESRA
MAVDGVRLEQRHGKARVRVGRVWREPCGRHHFVEWNVSISLLSDCLPAYTDGNNSDIVATDTMKNTSVIDVVDTVGQVLIKIMPFLGGKNESSAWTSPLGLAQAQPHGPGQLGQPGPSTDI